MYCSAVRPNQQRCNSKQCERLQVWCWESMLNPHSFHLLGFDASLCVVALRCIVFRRLHLVLVTVVSNRAFQRFPHFSSTRMCHSCCCTYAHGFSAARVSDVAHDDVYLIKTTQKQYRTRGSNHGKFHMIWLCLRMGCGNIQTMCHTHRVNICLVCWSNHALYGASPHFINNQQ